MWGEIKQALAQSTERFLTRFADLLPGTAALLVAVLISIVLGFLLAAIVRRVLTSMQFDQRLAQWGFRSSSEWPLLKSPTLLISRAIAASIIVAGFLIGIAAFDAEWTSLLARSIFAYIPNMLGAVLVLVVGSVIGLYYYLRVLVAMAMPVPAERADAPHKATPFYGNALIAALLVLLVVLGAYPAPAIALIRMTVGFTSG